MNTNILMGLREIVTWEAGSWVSFVFPDMRHKIKGVYFIKDRNDIVTFRYHNSRGLVSPSRKRTSADTYYPRLKIHTFHSEECRYNPDGIPPTAEAVADAIIDAWEKFITDKTE